MSSDGDRRLLLDAGSSDLRRRLGPTAWAVLEEVLLASVGPADRCRSSVSVRALAARLGLAKDTVAKALGRLRRAGMITACQSRTTTGMFAAGSYQLSVPNTIAIVSDDATRSSASITTSGRNVSRPTDTQLSLPIDS
jgi:DNA-binding transcriptional ArsR family regulator